MAAPNEGDEKNQNQQQVNGEEGPEQLTKFVRHLAVM